MLFERQRDGGDGLSLVPEGLTEKSRYGLSAGDERRIGVRDGLGDARLIGLEKLAERHGRVG